MQEEKGRTSITDLETVHTSINTSDTPSGPQEVEHPIIGASLSEPHTSVTALRTRVSMLVALFVWTDHLP